MSKRNEISYARERVQGNKGKRMRERENIDEGDGTSKENESKSISLFLIHCWGDPSESFFFNFFVRCFIIT